MRASDTGVHHKVHAPSASTTSLIICATLACLAWGTLPVACPGPLPGVLLVQCGRRRLKGGLLTVPQGHSGAQEALHAPLLAGRGCIVALAPVPLHCFHRRRASGVSCGLLQERREALMLHMH